MMGWFNNKVADTTVIDDLEKNFGDLIYDLFLSVLWNQKGAKLLYTSFWRKTSKQLLRQPELYQKYSRAWTIQQAVHTLLEMQPKLGRVLTAPEQVMLDANLNIPARLRQFESYFHKLTPTEQILLLLRDKYGLPYTEISAALEMPEGSLRVRHQQSLRSLE